jgi:hypothetical protein
MIGGGEIYGHRKSSESDERKKIRVNALRA